MTGKAGLAVVALVVVAGCMSAPAAEPTGADAGTTPTAAETTTPDRTPTGTDGGPAGADGSDGSTTDDAGDGDPADGNDSTGADRTGIEVRGGRLPVDANGTFRRVRSVLEANDTPPDYVRVLTDEDVFGPNESANDTNGSDGTNESTTDDDTNESDREDGDGSDDSDGGRIRSFRGVLGVYSGDGSWRERLEYRYRAVTGFNGVASVYPGQKPPELVETILAHELVHYVQFQRGYMSRLRSNLSGGTTDGSFVVRAVMEGMAVYVTDAYVERYLPNASSNTELYRRIRAVAPPGGPARYGNSWYFYGVDYYRDRVDDPSDAPEVVETPPRTGEQVLHGYLPGEEPPRNLSVNASSSGKWLRIGTDRVGEPLLRVALQNGLNRSAADRVAAGWGNDSLQIYRSSEFVNASYAWVVRWDDPANATEFETGFREYLDARGNRSGTGWTVLGRTFDVRRIGPATTAVLVGPESFVEGTTVARENGTVRVVPPDDDSTEAPTRTVGPTPRPRRSGW